MVSLRGSRLRCVLTKILGRPRVFWKGTGRKRAFVLLYALVILAAVLGASLTLAHIAMRSFSVNRQQHASLLANYAAQAAAECMLYWRIREGAQGTYRCGEPATSGAFNAASVVRATVRYTIDGKCYEARLEVDNPNRTIRSRGYNTCNPTPGNPAVVERGYLITY